MASEGTVTMQGTSFTETRVNGLVELTYKAEPTLTMTCIARVKAAEVCKERDEESDIEYGQVDLRICLEAILNARFASVTPLLIVSPELKKEEWSVYALDPSEAKFSGNGTITSVIREDEPTPVIGKVKKKFQRETLEVELRLVKVCHSPSMLTTGPCLASKETADNIIRAVLSFGLTT